MQIGTASDPYGREREVFFDPQSPDEKLSNPHISITGETGTGKTQATKAILRMNCIPLGIPALILDFKDDYAKPDYASVEGFTVHDASFGDAAVQPDGAANRQDERPRQPDGAPPRTREHATAHLRVG